MIDWPNLIAGFLLGLVPSVVILIVERRHDRAKTREEVEAEWIAAATELLRETWQDDASSGSLWKAAAGLPLDRWRRVLGPDDFVAFERVHNAFATVESASGHAFDEAGRQRLAQAAEHLRIARMEFHNRVALARDEAYNRNVEREERAKVRQDYRQHPIQTWKRQRHNRRVHREDERRRAEG